MYQVGSLKKKTVVETRDPEVAKAVHPIVVVVDAEVHRRSVEACSFL